MSYGLNLLIAIDQLANVICGGSPDETLSAYSHRKQDWRRAWINRLFFWQTDHCLHAWESEVYRRQLPSVYGAENVGVQQDSTGTPGSAGDEERKAR